MLWWEGYPIPVGVARRVLSQTARRLESERAELAGLYERPDAFDDLVASSESARIPSSLIRQARKHMKRDRFPQLVDVVLRVALGQFEGYAMSSVDVDDIERGLGVQRARTDRILDVKPWLQDSESSLTMFSERMVGVHFDELVAASDDAALTAARDEFRPVANMLQGFAELMSTYFGRGAFGLTAIGDVMRTASPKQMAIIFTAWLVMRDDQAIRAGLRDCWRSPPVGR